MKDNATILEKAQTTVADLLSDGGYLPEASAKQFLEKIIAEAVLMSSATIRPMSAPEQSESRIGFGSRALHAATEAQALPEGKRSKPATSKAKLSAKEFKAEVRLSYDVLEDNIEGEALINTIQDLLKTRVALDVDDYCANSDVDAADIDYAQFDGLFKQASAYTADGGNGTMDKEVLNDMMIAMPQQFRKDRSKVAFLLADRCELDYRHSLAERATVGGDKWLVENVPVYYGGSPVMTVPVFPVNLGQAGKSSVALYTDPKNIIIGFWKKIGLDTDKDISSSELVVVSRVRFDVKFSEPNAVVKGYNILAG